MKKIFKEPLLIFLLLGGAIFVLFQQVSSDYQPDNAEIVVTEGRVKALLLSFEKVWQRSPSDKEVDGLIQNYIREEVLYREALALGLDKNDGVVRRRLHQKMEFLSEDLASLNKPNEQELQAYLTANQETYRQPSRFSFQQVYLNTSKRGQTAKTDAVALLAKLKEQDTNAKLLGDPLMMINHQFNLETEREIERVLGSDFLQSLLNTPIGDWQGPIMSGFGWHLVRIDERIDAKAPALNEVREQVIRDWSVVKRKQVNEKFYESLRKQYKVTVVNHQNDKINDKNLAKLSVNKVSQ